VLESDGELGAGEISLDTARAIAAGGPWGQGFPEPLFDGAFGVVASRLVGERHLKLWLRAEAVTAPVEAIAFGYFDEPEARRPAPGERWRLAYRLQPTEYGGRPRAELVAEWLQAAD
jgi:single-stranded-DNA-specific exonuclease